MRLAAVISMVLSILVWPSLVVAQESLVGRRVIVIHDKASLKASDNKVEQVGEYSVFTVDREDGDLLWIMVLHGHLRRADVVAYEEAVDHYTRQLEKERSAANYWSRAQIWRLNGESDNALADANEAIRLAPSESKWYLHRGLVWEDQKEFTKAIDDYSEAIRLDPKYADAFLDRGNAWYNKNEYDKAIDDYTEAIRLEPNDAAAFYNRGIAWGVKSEYEKEMDDYTESMRLDAKNKFALNDLAWIRATCQVAHWRDSGEALKYATAACELTEWKEASPLDTLAAGYAEAGDFKKAVECQKKAIDLAAVEKKEEFASRLKLYENSQPYHEPTSP